MYVFGSGGVGVDGVGRLEDWVWALPIEWGQGNCWAWCGWCRWGMDRELGAGYGGVVLCMYELCVRILCVDGRSRYIYIYSVLGGYLCILDAPSVNPVAPYRYLLTTMYLFMAYIANTNLFVCGWRTWICLDIIGFYREQRHLSSGPAWLAFKKR